MSADTAFSLSELQPTLWWKWRADEVEALRHRMVEGGHGELLGALDRWIGNEESMVADGLSAEVAAIKEAIAMAPPTRMWLSRGIHYVGTLDEAMSAYAPGTVLSMGLSSFSHDQALALAYANMRAANNDPGVAVVFDVKPRAAAIPHCTTLKTKDHPTRGAAKFCEWISGGDYLVKSVSYGGVN